MKGVTKVHRVPSNWKDTVRGKFLEDKKNLDFFLSLGQTQENLTKILTLQYLWFCIFRIWKKYVCPFSDMDFGAIPLKLPGELERIVQSIFH